MVSGTGTGVGTTASTIIGAANGTINLGSQPITMTYDGSDPALYVPQGALRLTGNSITVNTTSGQPLTNGTYIIAKQSIGNIVSGGGFAVFGTALSAGANISIIASNNVLLLTISNASTNAAPIAPASGTYYYLGNTNGNFTSANWSTTDPTNGTSVAFSFAASNVAIFNLTATNNVNEIVSYASGSAAYNSRHGGMIFNNARATTVTNFSFGLGSFGPSGFFNGAGGTLYGFVANAGAGAVTIGNVSDGMYLAFDSGPNVTWINNSTAPMTINAEIQNGINGSSGGAPVMLTLGGSGNIVVNGRLDQQNVANDPTRNPMGLTYAGSGVLTLSNPSNGIPYANSVFSYSGGTYIQSGTIALTNMGAIGSGTVSISAGGTLDVSGLTTNNFTFGTNQALVASGAGMTPGSTAATIKGKAGGTVNLGAQSVTLGYNGTDPALYLSQGTLVLSNNTFIINTPGSIPLNTNKTYVIAQQASGNVTVAGSSFSAYGTAFTPGYTYSIYVVNNQVLLSFGLPYWDASGTNWQNTSSWSTVPSGVTPDPSAVPGAYDVPVFNIPLSNNVAQTVSLNGNVAVAGMVFNNSNSTAINGGNGAYSLTTANSGITINPGGGALTIGSTNASQGVTNLLSANQPWINNGTGAVTVLNYLRTANTNQITLTLSGSNSFSFTKAIVSNGAGSLALDYAGTSLLALNSSNSFSGGMTVESGVAATTAAASANALNSAFGYSPLVTLGNVGGANNLASMRISLANGLYTNKFVLSANTSGNLILGMQSTSTATISGGVTGANNLVLYESGGGILNFTGATINHAGSLVITPDIAGIGPTNSVINVYSGIGANVTSVTVVTNSSYGTNTLMLAGTNLYTGSTYIGGKLQLTGGATLASTNLSLSAGSLLDVSGLGSTFTLGASQTITAGVGTGFVNGNANVSAGTLALTYTNGTLALALTNGVLTLSSNTVVQVSPASVLAVGKYAVMTAAGGVAGTMPPVVVNGAGVAPGTITVLEVVGTNVNLVVAGPPVATNLMVIIPVGTNLNLSVSDLGTNWSDPNGTNVVLRGVVSPSVRGFAVSTNGGVVNYVATSAGSDTINYGIVDGYGATNAGTITVAAWNTTMTPVITPASGGYLSPQTVTITNGEAGVTIYYTTNGATPTTSSASGPSPVTILLPANTNGFVVSAMAAKAMEFNSPVVSATYGTIVTPTWVNAAGGSWTNGVNWSNNVVANATGVSVDFSQVDLVLNPVPVSLDSALTVGQLAFGDAVGTNGWLVTPGNGGSLTLDSSTNQPVINVVNGATTLAVPINGTAGLVKTGSGVLTLAGTNPITGSIIVSNGTLALANAGAIANSTNIVIPAGGTVDVSAITNFMLSPANSLTALGRGTNVGSTAATLVGAAGGTVSLGNSPVTLDTDGMNPSLYVSQGTLVLNQNPFTINSASPLGYGDYVIAQSTDGIMDNGPYTVTGTALGVGSTGTIMVVGNQLILHVVTPPVIYTDDSPVTNTLTGGASGIAFGSTNNTQVTGTNGTLLVGPGGITATPGSGGGTIGGASPNGENVALDGSQTWTNNGNGPITLVNTVSNGTPDPATLTLTGTNGFNFDGPVTDGGGPLTIVNDTTGTTTLSPSNSLSGGVIAKEGTIATGDAPSATDPNTAFGSNPWIILGDTDPNTNSASLDLGTGIVTNGVVLASGTTGDLVVGVKTNANSTITGGIIGTNDLILSGSPGGLLTISDGSINNVGTLTIEGNPTAGGSAGPVVIDSGIGTNVTALTIGTNSPAGTNVVTLAGTNLYTGTTTVGGTLILAATGSIANSTNIVIPKGGVVDVSSQPGFMLQPGQTLTALGAGTNVGSTAATIRGASGGMVDLGSSPINLTYDGSNPSLFVSQGTLVLNTNPFTINAGSLTNGTYVIAQSTDGITGTGPFTVTGLTNGATGMLTVAGNQLVMTVNNLPPVAAPLAIPLNAGISLKLAVSNVATNWTDPNHYTVTLVSVQTNSSLGKLVTLSGSTIFYPKATANDTITYTIRNSAGATATGVINIVITPLTGQASPTIVVNGGTATVSFAGIPGYTYYVQRTASLTPATWATVSTNVAPVNGVFKYVDSNSPQPAAFYRLSTAP